MFFTDDIKSIFLHLLQLFSLHPEFRRDILLKLPFSKLFNKLTEKEKVKLLLNNCISNKQSNSNSKNMPNNVSIFLYYHLYYDIYNERGVTSFLEEGKYDWIVKNRYDIKRRKNMEKNNIHSDVFFIFK